MEQTLINMDTQPERAFLIGIHPRKEPDWLVEESLEELGRLTHSAGAGEAGRQLCRLHTPDAGTFLGRGKAAELAEQAAAVGATLAIVDADLSPAQGRNLEDLFKMRVIDRTQLILDIFAQRAHTREGSLQVELAQLDYLLPRLRGMWTHLERQKGGIGLRGPGEKQLELDRRRIQQRITRLRAEVEDVRRHRHEQRRGRRRHGWALISLVGYTNAGKSTLLNRLTGAGVFANDQLFATLDPTTRKLELPNNQMALVTDTVGFIRKLPHHLVAAFKSTLEEVLEADLLVHVIDGAHPHAEEQVKAVHAVLRELEADEKPRLDLLNKMDAEAAGRQRQILQALLPDALPVSGLSGEGMEALRMEISERLRQSRPALRLRIPAADSRVLAQLEAHAHILHKQFVDEHWLVAAQVPPELAGRLGAYVAAASPAAPGRRRRENRH